MGMGISLVSMMLVEATDELKNLDVISLISPLLPWAEVTFDTSSRVTEVVADVVVVVAATRRAEEPIRHIFFSIVKPASLSGLPDLSW
jgi:hypothetical protein